MKEIKRDLTSGSITKNLIAMSLPTMLGMLGQTLYDVVDMIWVGRISGEAVAGISLFSSIFWLVEVLNEIIGTSSVAMITQSYGSGNLAKTNRIIEQTIIFKTLVAIIAALIMYLLLEPFIKFFSNDLEVISSAIAYGKIRTYFLPIFFATYSCFSALRCTGDPTSQMWIMIVVSVLNMILDPILMFEEIPFVGIKGAGLGVAGAGIATVISMVFAFVISFILLASGRTKVKLSMKGLFRLDLAIDKKLITIGLPSGGEMLLRQGSNLIITKFIAMYGTAAIAALGIGNRLSSLVFMPIFGLSSGGGTIVGQNLGAGNIERAEKTGKTTCLFGGSIVTIIMGLAMIFPSVVMKLFVDDPVIIQTGISMIRLMGSSFIVVSFAISLGCVFTGSGYNIPFLISAIVARWLVQLPIILFFVYLAPKIGINWGLNGIWASFLLSDLAETIVILSYYKKGKWKTTRAI